eukprot:Em0007g302a
MVLLLDTSKETERSIANYFPSKLKAVLGKLCIHTPPVDLCIFSIRFDLEARYVRWREGQIPDGSSNSQACRFQSSLLSPEHPAPPRSPTASRTLRLVAQKVGSKTPGPPEVTEREKSPVTVTEKEKSPPFTGPYNNPPRLAGGEIRNWGLLGGNGDGNIFSLSTYQCNGREHAQLGSSIRVGYRGNAREVEGALDVTFWKQRKEMAVSFEREIAEKASEEVDRHLDGTTKFLREANCTPLGLAEMWDGAQAESVKLAQHQLETAGSRKRGRGRKAELDKPPTMLRKGKIPPFPCTFFVFPLKSTSRNIFGNLVPLPTCKHARNTLPRKAQ